MAAKSYRLTDHGLVRLNDGHVLLQNEIVNYLRFHPRGRTARQIADDLGRPVGHVNVALAHLQQPAPLVATGEQVYTLTDNPGKGRNRRSQGSLTGLEWRILSHIQGHDTPHTAATLVSEGVDDDLNTVRMALANLWGTGDVQYA